MALERIALTARNISHIPETSGIYYFFDSEGNALYVGKASNLRRRIEQHFEMIPLAQIVDTLLVKEALPIEVILKLDLHVSSNSVIDMNMHQVANMAWERSARIHQTELRRIFELKPTYNSQTASPQYHRLRTTMNHLLSPLLDHALEEETIAETQTEEAAIGVA